jgi:hypothetical protein
LVFSALAGRADSSNQDGAQYHKHSNEVIKELTRAEGKVEAAKNTSDPLGPYQELAWARSTAGDYLGALAAFRQAMGTGAPAPADPAEVDKLVAGYLPEPAIPAIVAEARTRQIVILNEAHHLSRHRAFAQELAAGLHTIGFEYLACETFTPNVGALEKRGYVAQKDGTYTTEPLFADFVRQSLKLGYVPVAYESDAGEKAANQTEADSMNEREADQANNLVRRIFKVNPRAKIFVYVGFSHLMKHDQLWDKASGQRVKWMALRLREATGIDALTIDQVAMTDPAPDTLNAAVLNQVFANIDPGITSLILRKKDTPGYLVVGHYQGDADMQVYHRPTEIVRGRPDWLRMGGYREPREIPQGLLPKTRRRLVQAFAQGENSSAIAVDQLLVEPGSSDHPVFMLPPGQYNYSYEE